MKNEYSSSLRSFPNFSTLFSAKLEDFATTRIKACLHDRVFSNLPLESILT